MNTYTKKLPQYQAVQLQYSAANTDEVAELAGVKEWIVKRICDSGLLMQIAGQILRVGDYLVKAPDGTLSVMTEREIKHDFDLVREPEATMKVSSKLVFNEYGPCPTSDDKDVAPANRISAAVERERLAQERAAHLAQPNPWLVKFGPQSHNLGMQAYANCAQAGADVKVERKKDTAFFEASQYGKIERKRIHMEWPARTVIATFTDQTVGDEMFTPKIIAAMAEYGKVDPRGETNGYLASNGVQIKFEAAR